MTSSISRSLTEKTSKDVPSKFDVTRLVEALAELCCKSCGHLNRMSILAGADSSEHTSYDGLEEFKKYFSSSTRDVNITLYFSFDGCRLTCYFWRSPHENSIELSSNRLTKPEIEDLADEIVLRIEEILPISPPHEEPPNIEQTKTSYVIVEDDKLHKNISLLSNLIAIVAPIIRLGKWILSLLSPI